MLEIGRPAPSFSLPSTSAKLVALDELRGRKVVLYFYPRDDTPGCTKEACDFRDQLARVHSAGAEVYGVSKDSLASHAKFRGKYALPFELLSDANNAVAKAYGAYGKKNLYGREVEGTIRSTFLIDERGRIARVWSPVKVDGHVEQVLAAVRGEEVPKASRHGSPAKSDARGERREPEVRGAKKSAETLTTKSLKPAREPAVKLPPKSTAKEPAKRVAQRSRRKPTP